jgi:hypothetical protein
MSFRQRSVSDVGLTNGRASKDSLRLSVGQFNPPEITGTYNISPRTPREDPPINHLYANILAKHERQVELKKEIVEKTNFSA